MSPPTNMANQRKKKKKRRKNLFAAPGLGVDPLPSRYSSPSEESEESPVNGIERIWLARCEQNHYFSLISFLMSARTTKNGTDNDFGFLEGLGQNPWEKKNG